MSNNLKIQVILAAVDKATAPMKQALKNAKLLSGNIVELQNNLRKIEKIKTKISGFEQAKKNIDAATQSIEQHRQKLAQLSNGKNASAAFANKLKDAFNMQKKEVQRLMAQQNDFARMGNSATFAKGVPVLEKARKQLDQLGVQYSIAKNKVDEFNRKIKAENKEIRTNRLARIRQYQQLRQLREQLQAAGISTKNLGNSERTLAEKIAHANQALEKQKRRLTELEQKQKAVARYNAKVANLKSRSEHFASLGQRATTQAVGLGYAVSRPISQFMEFEDAMAGVARQVQGLKDDSGQFTAEYGQWAGKIRELSKELPLATTDIANMITAGARMEVPKEQLAEFVALSTKMATAFDAESPEELAELYGKVGKNFQLSAQQGRELADVINYLDDNAISKGTDIINFLNDTSGIAGIVNIDPKNLAALGSTLLTAGNEASTSAKAVESTFNRLSKAPSMKPVSKALASLGLDAKKIQKGMVEDAEGTLLQVIEKIKKLPKHLQAEAITGIAGGNYNTQMASLVSNTEEYRRQIALANAEEAKGSMDREFQTRMTTLSAKWQIFKNQLFNTNTIVGGALKNTLLEMMDSIAGVLDKVNTWVEANPELTASLAKWTIYGIAALGVFGVLASTLSFMLYPIFRVGLGIKHLNSLLPENADKIKSVIRGLTSWKTTGIWLGNALKGLGKILFTLLNPFTYLKSAFNLAAGALRGLAIASRFLVTTPIGAFITLLALGATYVYTHWEQVKRFFSGFWEGLKSGLAPVIEKFKPLGDAFGVVVGWIKQAVKWVMDLISPVQTTTVELLAASKAGRNFGEWLAAGIDLVTKPLQWLVDTIKWVIDNMPSLSSAANAIVPKEHAEQISRTANMAAMSGFSSGGYTGNGGKYQPKGIVHGGEYVMTKETTSRLGVGLLDRLNYGSKLGATALMGASVAMAQPIKIDTRPPLTAHQAVGFSQPSANPVVNITVNAQAGMNEQQLAQYVARTVSQALRQSEYERRAKARGSYWDKG